MVANRCPLGGVSPVNNGSPETRVWSRKWGEYQEIQDSGYTPNLKDVFDIKRISTVKP